MIVFLVSGLWHGANWTFVLWGGMHGLFIVISRRFKKFFDSLHPALNWIVTFSFVNIAWLFFRADSVRDALRIIYRIGRLDFTGINQSISECFELVEFRWLFDRVFQCDILSIQPFFFGIGFILIAFASVLGSKNSFEKMTVFKPTLGKLLCISILLVWCVFSFSGISTFLYFNF